MSIQIRAACWRRIIIDRFVLVVVLLLASTQLATADEITEADIFERPVSIDVEDVPLRDALRKLAQSAGVESRPDVLALSEAGLDLNQKVTSKFKNVPLGEALGKLIDWQQHPGVFRRMHGDKLVLTTIRAWQERTKSKLPNWLKPFHGKGLSAGIDANDDVVSITTNGFVTDELLGHFKLLPRLRELHIEVTTSLTATGAKHLAEYPHLRKLTLYSVNKDGNGIGDTFIKHLVNVKTLRELYISECGTTDAGAKLLEQMPQLTHLKLRQEGRLTDAALDSIGKLKNLKHLDLSSYVGTRNYGWMRFSEATTQRLAGLKNLERLYLTGHTVAPSVLQFPKLKRLSLGGPGVSDDCANSIAKMRQLNSVALNFTAITDSGLKKVATLPQLRSLDLDSSVLTDAGIAQLKSANKLEHLQLRLSKITDQSLQHISHIKTLKRIDVSGSGQPGVNPGRVMTGSGLAHLKTLPHLRTLWITNLQDVAAADGLKQLKQLRQLTLTMVAMRTQELDALSDALPETTINYLTGGWSSTRKPKKTRKQARNSISKPKNNLKK